MQYLFEDQAVADGLISNAGVPWICLSSALICVDDAPLISCLCSGKADQSLASTLEVFSLLADRCNVCAVAANSKWLRGSSSSGWVAANNFSRCDCIPRPCGCCNAVFVG
jgi:hypothetical protein